MSTLTDADISELVDSAFDECVLGGIREDRPCGGNRAAYMVYHDCLEGIICRLHYEVWLRELAQPEAGWNQICSVCGRHFPSIHDVVKFYPL